MRGYESEIFHLTSHSEFIFIIIPNTLTFLISSFWASWGMARGGLQAWWGMRIERGVVELEIQESMIGFWNGLENLQAFQIKRLPTSGSFGQTRQDDLRYAYRLWSPDPFTARDLKKTSFRNSEQVRRKRGTKKDERRKIYHRDHLHPSSSSSSKPFFHLSSIQIGNPLKNFQTSQITIINGRKTSSVELFYLLSISSISTLFQSTSSSSSFNPNVFWFHLT